MHASKAILPIESLDESYEARVVDWGEYTA
jgi:hypothetical protein